MSNRLYRVIVEAFLAFLLVALGLLTACVWISVASDLTGTNISMGGLVTALIAGVAWFICWFRGEALEQ